MSAAVQVAWIQAYAACIAASQASREAGLIDVATRDEVERIYLTKLRESLDDLELARAQEKRLA